MRRGLRRQFRREVRREMRRGLEPEIPPLLLRANQLMSAGDYVEAASALEQLARAAEARGGPRAPFFYVQAGRARFMAGQAQAAMESLERGLGLFAVRGQTGRVMDMGERIVDELRQHAFSVEAQQISDYAKSLVPGFGPGASQSAAIKRPHLPTHCPGCGAPLRPDEVEWLDDATAECAYCGSSVRGG